MSKVVIEVNDRARALEFWTEKVAGNQELGTNLDAAKTDEKWAIIAHQAADAPLFSIETDDCMGEYTAPKGRGVEFEGEPEELPYGIGVLMKDLYGNRIHINQDECHRSPQNGPRTPHAIGTQTKARS